MRTLNELRLNGITYRLGGVTIENIDNDAQMATIALKPNTVTWLENPVRSIDEMTLVPLDDEDAEFSAVYYLRFTCIDADTSVALPIGVSVGGDATPTYAAGRSVELGIMGGVAFMATGS